MRENRDKQMHVLPGYCEDITEKSENFEKSLDSQHLQLVEINSSQFFETYESATLPEELSEIKGGGSFGYEGTVQIIPDQLKHDGEIFCGSEEHAPSVGYHNDLEASPTEKIPEIAPFGLSKRVDKLMEKLLCLRKVLRGEITPPLTDSCLPGEEEISCEESHSTNKKQLLPEQKDGVVKTSMLSNSGLEDCEQNSSNAQLNINHVGTQCLQEILESQEDPTLKVDEVRCLESLEANNTDTTSLFECNFSCKPIERQPHQVSDIDVNELLHSPGEDLGKKDFLSSSKHSINWEGNNYFGPQCISDALDGHIPIVQECALNKPFDILEVESRTTDTFTSVQKGVVYVSLIYQDLIFLFSYYLFFSTASASRNTTDLVEEISRKLINFRISSSRNATKSSIKTPRTTKSTGIFKLHSSVGIIRDKENKQNTKMMNFSSSEHKIRNPAASAGSIRRPLRSVTNQKLD
ncbi:hypothetical protein KSP40_PGU022562 [Platanthera guangdongensis]|uniref:Uncharacterized protein n=1 Tax=Platanthera guangdongensis TaxID=2320717 RepID=A0ABR2M5X1_9ASPA